MNIQLNTSGDKRLQALVASAIVLMAPREHEGEHAPERRGSAEAPGGMVLLCTNETLAENLSRRLSGLTRSNLRDVEALRPGTPIFLFNVNDKRMHGVFEAVRQRGAGVKSAADRGRHAPCSCLRWAPARSTWCRRLG